MADPVDPDKTLIFRNHAGELHDLTFRNAAFTQDHYLNLSGGNDKGTFSSSLGYYSEDGQIISTNYQTCERDYQRFIQVVARFDSECRR